ncbi:MAG: hypothetical protein AAF291_16315 [Pseudomonadota bacterium]
MRKTISMKLAASLAVAAVGGAPLLLASAPASAAAQSDPTETVDEAEIANWPAEKQAAYNAWPAQTQAYYWTLSEERQQMFWGLTDPDKIALSGMSAEDQAKAWAQIEGRSSSPEEPS